VKPLGGTGRVYAGRCVGGSARGSPRKQPGRGRVDRRQRQPAVVAQTGDNRGRYSIWISPGPFEPCIFLPFAESAHPSAGEVACWPAIKPETALPWGQPGVSIESRGSNDGRWTEFQLALTPFRRRISARNRDRNGVSRCAATARNSQAQHLERICSLAFGRQTRRGEGQPSPITPVEIDLDRIYFE